MNAKINIALAALALIVGDEILSMAVLTILLFPVLIKVLKGGYEHG